ncbi:MAG: DUF1320 domain-containing protein [Burkholderiaceae bacterium]|nr:DUF1320 domain-containing protein [Burkholderiaceae bacterium]
MPYATQAEMIASYGMPKLVALTDIGQPMTGELQGAVLDAKLDDASAEIDGYLAGRMSVPLASPPPVIKLMCRRLAYYLLLGPAATEVDQADAKAVRDYLRAVAAGNVSLTSPDQAPAQAGAGSVLFEQGAKDWGREAA